MRLALSPAVACAAAVLAASVGPAKVARAQPPPLGVRFELNDAQLKDRPLAGVAVSVSPVGGGGALASGLTGSDGRWTTRLPPGVYEVSYRLEGYVPYTSGATELREDGQLVTVSLSRLLEATAAGGGEVRIILNWGSRPDQVRDADSHVACACGAAERHVYYKVRAHEAAGHKLELDVDDTDWGGPETITLTNPAPGSYLYWVHDYSGPPATLGASDVVVRVVIGAEEAGEFRVFKGVTRRAWRPFKAIEVGKDGRPTLVRFTDDEIAEGADLADFGGFYTPEPTTSAPGGAPATGAGRPPFEALLLALVVIALVIRAVRRRRRA